MKTLFVFNHPAPYKVHVFNELAKLTDIRVIFERKKAKDRPDSFYADNEYNFPVIFLKNNGTIFNSHEVVPFFIYHFPNVFVVALVVCSRLHCVAVAKNGRL